MNRVPEESSVLVEQAKEAVARFSQGDEALIDSARRFVSESLNLDDLSHYKIFPQACFLIERDALRFGEKGRPASVAAGGASFGHVALIAV